MKTYKGQRLNEGCEVYVHNDDGKSYPLPQRLEIRNHSPTGFEWGYGGSGPAQLALAILVDFFGPLPSPGECPFCGARTSGWQCHESECGYNGQNEDRWKHILGGKVHYQDFKGLIAQFKRDSFALTGEDIETWATNSGTDGVTP